MSAAVPQPLLLAGPTAAGKSAVALVLAEQLNGEIVSVDSMQVYRGLDIGTAKPSRAEQARVPHHLVDIVDLTEGFDAAQFVRRATTAVAEIQARGRVPILCGGTGLYFRAWREGLGAAPPADAGLRAELAEASLDVLLGELERCDPATFGVIDRQNRRRVERAVEVLRLTGRPFITQRAPWREPAPTGDCFGLAVPRESLVARINARVDAMFRAGLVAETRELLPRGLAENATAMQAIGYRQVVEHLRGGRDLAATIELVKIRTRQFAKRQLTWFHRQAAATWLDVPPGQTAAETAAAIIHLRETA